jgi:hypothetical protein
MEFTRVALALQGQLGDESVEPATSAISFEQNATASTPAHTVLVGFEVWTSMLCF